MKCDLPYYILNLDYENIDYWKRSEYLMDILEEAATEHYILNFEILPFLTEIVKYLKTRNRKKTKELAKRCKKKKYHIYSRLDKKSFADSCLPESKPKFYGENNMYEIYSNNDICYRDIIEFKNISKTCRLKRNLRVRATDKISYNEVYYGRFRTILGCAQRIEVVEPYFNPDAQTNYGRLISSVDKDFDSSWSRRKTYEIYIQPIIHYRADLTDTMIKKFEGEAIEWAKNIYKKCKHIEEVRIRLRNPNLVKNHNPSKQHDRFLILDKKIQYMLGQGHAVFSDKGEGIEKSIVCSNCRPCDEKDEEDEFDEGDYKLIYTTRGE